MRIQETDPLFPGDGNPWKLQKSTGQIDCLHGISSYMQCAVASLTHSPDYSCRELHYMTDFETGIVKWFDPQLGYGYIARDTGGELYVHYSAVICEESECHLEEGNKVRYTVHDGPKGPQAQDVIVLN